MCLNTLPLYFFNYFYSLSILFAHKDILLVIYAPMNMCSAPRDDKGRQILFYATNEIDILITFQRSYEEKMRKACS